MTLERTAITLAVLTAWAAVIAVVWLVMPVVS
jgi:hypothetical protein